MKKQFLLNAIPLVCLAATVSAYAQPSGFYVGARGGVLQSLATAQTEAEAAYVTPSAGGLVQAIGTRSGNTALGHNYGEGDFFVGYGRQISCSPFYLGGEIFVNEATRENRVKSQTESIIVGGEDEQISAIVNSSTKVKLNSFEYGIDFKPGVLINPQTLLYGRFGVSQNTVHLTTNASLSVEEDTISTPVSASKRQNVTGWRFGIGLEEYLCSCISFTADYIYTTYGGSRSVSALVEETTDGDVTNAVETTGSGKISTQAFLVGLKYSFG